MSEWIKNQIDKMRQLEGEQIFEWRGTEMALAEPDGEKPIVWNHSSVPMLQFSVVELRLESGWLAIGTYQDDDEFGLRVLEESTTSDLPCGDPASIFRDRPIPELAIGQIKSVMIDQNERSNIASLNFEINGSILSFKAGEVYENDDSTFRIVSMDESILIQVDGQMPCAV